jgi:hypothetical protein
MLSQTNHHFDLILHHYLNKERYLNRIFLLYEADNCWVEWYITNSTIHVVTFIITAFYLAYGTTSWNMATNVSWTFFVYSIYIAYNWRSYEIIVEIKTNVTLNIDLFEGQGLGIIILSYRILIFNHCQ